MSDTSFRSRVCGVLTLAVMAILLAGCAGQPGMRRQVDWASLGITHLPAPSEYPEDPAVILLDDGKMEIVGSGELVRSVFDRHTVVKVLTGAGQRFANIVIPYGSGSSVEEVQARTVSPDGSVHPLLPDEVFDVSLYPNFVFYSDQRARIFTLPAVEEGAILEYSYRINIGGRSFWHFWEFQSTIPTLHSRFALIRPSEWEVNARLYAIALEPHEIKVPEGFKATTVWEASALPPIRPEPAMPPLHDLTARLAIAPLGFHTWNDVAHWYDGLAAPRMKGGAAVRALAESLTRGAATDRMKLQRLFSWVRDHVRYMAVEIGLGGYQPHFSEDVCGRLYGDCKDMTTVLCALGAEAGLDLRPVLVSTWQNGATDTTLPSPLEFNHAVAYWPGDGEGEIWMDATEKAAPFGTLPWYDQGVTVLVVDPGGKGTLRTTPSVARGNNIEQERWEVHLQPDGSAEIRSLLRLSGAPALETREVMMDAPPRERRRKFEEMLVQRVPGALLDSLQIDGLQAASDSLQVSLTFRTPFFCRFDYRLAAIRPSLFSSTMLPDLLRPGTRSYPVRFRFGEQSLFTAAIHLPVGWLSESPPADDSLNTPFGAARWRFHGEPGLLLYESFLDFPGGTVPPEKYADLQKFLEEIRRWEVREILVRRGP